MTGVQTCALPISDNEQDQCLIKIYSWNRNLSLWVECRSVENSGSQNLGSGKKAYWKVKDDLNEVYSPNSYFIFVVADDGNMENSEGSGYYGTIIIDTKNPANVGCILPENNALIKTLNPTLEALQAYDDSELEYYFIIDDNPEFDDRHGLLQESGWITERTWTLPKLSYAKAYWWKVKCGDNYGNETDYSESFSFTTRAYNFYVDVNNTTGVEDGSIQNPYNSITEAVNDANGEAVIKVAKGIYYESVFVPYDGIKFYGGYDPADWRRDLKTNKTVVDGSGNNGFIFYASYNIAITENTIIDGFTIQNCIKGIESINSWVDYPYYSAKMSPVIRNNTIENNEIGIYYQGSQYNSHGDESLIEYNIIRNNTYLGVKAGDKAVIKNNIYSIMGVPVFTAGI